MNTALFFDDQRLYARRGLTRRYGMPALIPDATYRDPQNNAFLHSVWRDDAGKFHLFYLAFTLAHKLYIQAAESDDGLHWRPRNTAAEALPSFDFPNQLLPTDDAELACVYFDEHCDRTERLKALVARYHYDDLEVEDLIYASEDGVHWHILPGVHWSDRGCEPGAGCFWSEALRRHVILARAGWGIRRLCVYETPDFKTFLPSRVALQVDSLDEPQAETYGMPSFAYKGWYIGFLWMYHTPDVNATKYWGGAMDCQLAYSVNGVHWQRSLRTPFLGNELPETAGMVYPMTLRTEPDGSLLITAAAHEREHGHFNEPGASIVTYRLRQDGFIGLEADGSGGSLCTRQVLLQSGEIAWNLTAAEATVALLDAEGAPLAGFSHADCVPFSGDSTAWRPQYRGERAVEALAGQIFAMELRLREGCVYAYSGDFVPMMNQEAARYEKFGTVPDTLGF